MSHDVDTQRIADTIARQKWWQASRLPAWTPPSAFPYRADDNLLEISPHDYVRVIAKIDVPDYGRMDCPLPDHDDTSRDFAIYAQTRSWYCFGCNRGGSIYDFAAQMWGMGDRGEAFVELRQDLLRLAHVND